VELFSIALEVCARAAADGTRDAKGVAVATVSQPASPRELPMKSTSLCSARRLVVSALMAVTLVCGLVAGEGSASAQVVTIAPPAVRVEAVGRPPSPQHFWIPGYWGWRAGGGHYWVGGRWERARRGYGWSGAHWDREGRGWRFSPGRWHRR
jgi:hypothetical protein